MFLMEEMPHHLRGQKSIERYSEMTMHWKLWGGPNYTIPWWRDLRTKERSTFGQSESYGEIRRVKTVPLVTQTDDVVPFSILLTIEM